MSDSREYRAKFIADANSRVAAISGCCEAHRHTNRKKETERAWGDIHGFNERLILQSPLDFSIEQQCNRVLIFELRVME